MESRVPLITQLCLAGFLVICFSWLAVHRNDSVAYRVSLVLNGLTCGWVGARSAISCGRDAGAEIIDPFFHRLPSLKHKLLLFVRALISSNPQGNFACIDRCHCVSGLTVGSK